jgi:NUDIX domain
VRVLRKLLLTTPRFKVYVESQRINSRWQQYYYLEKPDAVLIVPYTDEHIILLEVERPVLKHISVELPGGRIEPGERPLRAAQRELEEECQLTSRDWRLLATSYPLPSITTEKVFIYAARIVPRVANKISLKAKVEGIRGAMAASFEQAQKCALAGKMRCAVDAYALLLFLDSCTNIGRRKQR